MNGEFSQRPVMVAVDCLILTVRDGRLSLLMGKRTSPPFSGLWALPGSVLEVSDGSAEETVRRLLDEALPCARAAVEQLYTFTGTGRDPRGRVISISYLVIIPWDILRASLEHDSRKLACFALKLSGEDLAFTGEDDETLSEDQLAFDHGEIIRTGVRRLRNKIEYSDIGFSFLTNPCCFSLGELQEIFEAVQGGPMDSSNFRRFILNRFEKTGRLRQRAETSRGVRGRPAALYAFDRETSERSMLK